jgi:hypothetical protein
VLELGQLEEFWELLSDWIFWGKIQRRGTHVNSPKIGSRGEEKCFGGIQRFYAELRRELFGGNLNLLFFGVLVEVPREVTEEGGQLCFTLCVLGV